MGLVLADDLESKRENFNGSVYDALEIIYKYYKKSSSEFVQESVKNLGNTSNLHVMQHEYAIVMPESNIRIVGSDLATTCLIVIIRHQGSAWTLVAHVDDSFDKTQVRQIVESVNNLITNDKTFKLYLCGAYNAESDAISKGVLQNTLQVFLKETDGIALILKLALIGSLNTKFDQLKNSCVPVQQGIAINMEEGVIFPVSFDDFPPAMEVRHLRLQCANSEALFEAFDSKTNQIIIDKFSYSGLHYEAKNVVQMTDNEIRNNMSTSPMAEKDNFASIMRTCMQFVLDNKDDGKIFNQFGNKNLIYQLDSEGNWYKILT